MIKALKEGTAPWQKPWLDNDMPRNVVTGNRYKGMNSLILSEANMRLDYGDDPRWATFLQAQSKGWRIKKGAKPIKLTFFKPLEVEDQNSVNDKRKTVPVIRYFFVFHASQIEGIQPYCPISKEVKQHLELNTIAEQLVKNSGAVICYGGDQAYYSVSKDYIQLPKRDSFVDTVSYYATLLHELIHWTGHSSRKNRDISGAKDSISYAREELVAEIASMFLSVEVGIPMTEEHFANHASYVSSWIKLLSSDPNAFFKAEKDAERAVDYILEFRVNS